MKAPALERSRALWNRDRLDLSSDEVLAQVLDRGEIEAWRELYRMASGSPELCRRILRIIETVPLPFPHAWLAALAAVGEKVDFDARLPQESGGV